MAISRPTVASSITSLIRPTARVPPLPPFKVFLLSLFLVLDVAMLTRESGRCFRHEAVTNSSYGQVLMVNMVFDLLFGTFHLPSTQEPP